MGVKDTLIGETIRGGDLVVLATGMVPNSADGEGPSGNSTTRRPRC